MFNSDVGIHGNKRRRKEEEVSRILSTRWTANRTEMGTAWLRKVLAWGEESCDGSSPEAQAWTVREDTRDGAWLCRYCMDTYVERR